MAKLYVRYICIDGFDENDPWMKNDFILPNGWEWMGGGVIEGPRLLFHYEEIFEGPEESLEETKQLLIDCCRNFNGFQDFSVTE
jgi:hypothetical protein